MLVHAELRERQAAPAGTPFLVRGIRLIDATASSPDRGSDRNPVRLGIVL
jgi:hypothetical protein